MDKRYEETTTVEKMTADEGPNMGENSVREVLPMFLVAVTPEVLKHADTCRMCKRRSVILGILKFFQRWGVETFSMLFFEQITVADFMVIVIAPTATEMIHHRECIYQTFQKEVSQILTIEPTNALENGKGIKHNQNSAMVLWAAKDHPERTIEFLFNGDDVEIEDNKVFGREEPLVWEEGSSIFVNVGGNLQKVKIKRSGNMSRLGMGWDVVLQALEIKEGDYIVMVEAGNPYHFHLNVYSAYTKLQRQTVEGRIKLVHFIKIVTHKILGTGELVIPRMFWSISDISLKPLLDIIISGGRRFQCQHHVESHKLVGLQNFVRITGVEEGNVLLFRYETGSALAVTLFNGAAVKFKGHLGIK